MSSRELLVKFEHSRQRVEEDVCVLLCEHQAGPKSQSGSTAAAGVHTWGRNTPDIRQISHQIGSDPLQMGQIWASQNVLKSQICPI